MTKFEKRCFDSMMLRIMHDTRRQMSLYEDGKSGTHYVMIPLTDVLRELSTFVNTVKPKKKRNKK